MTTTNVSSVFESLRETFQKQDTVRDALREKREAAEIKIRAAHLELIAYHTTTDLKQTSAKIRSSLEKTGEGLLAIQSALPSNELGSFYKYGDIWLPIRQTISMISVVVEFLDCNQLPDIDRVKQMCGNHDFKLPLEDYLVGVCNAVSEFVRLSMNRVIMTDYQTPVHCAVFATQIFEALKELNFRNDFLRKRYDGVKYDIKKLEEIVYDLSIRGLIKKNPPPADSSDINKIDTPKNNDSTKNDNNTKDDQEPKTESNIPIDNTIQESEATVTTGKRSDGGNAAMDTAE